MNEGHWFKIKSHEYSNSQLWSQSCSTARSNLEALGASSLKFVSSLQQQRHLYFCYIQDFSLNIETKWVINARHLLLVPPLPNDVARKTLTSKDRVGYGSSGEMVEFEIMIHSSELAWLSCPSKKTRLNKEFLVKWSTSFRLRSFHSTAVAESTKVRASWSKKKDQRFGEESFLKNILERTQWSPPYF